MTADAYRYADGGGHSNEIQLLRYIDRFGVEAVTGKKVLSAGELKRMLYAEGIVYAYQDRSRGNAAEWVKENPGMNKLLYDAQRMVEDG